VALLGPSGSGKTTLLRVIAGLNTPDRGQVYFDGRDATALPVQDRRVGFVFQNYALFKHMTVADNIAYGLRVRPRRLRPSRKDIAARVGELLRFVQLEGLGERFPAQLSGGQRQRVALARALAIEPRVLLLDEPFGALDAQTRLALQLQLMEVLTAERKTVLLITHSVEEAIFLSTRILIISARPSRLLRVVDVPFPYPRTPALTGTPEFQKLRLELEEVSMQQYAEQQKLAAQSA